MRTLSPKFTGTSLDTNHSSLHIKLLTTLKNTPDNLQPSCLKIKVHITSSKFIFYRSGGQVSISQIGVNLFWNYRTKPDMYHCSTNYIIMHFTPIGGLPSCLNDYISNTEVRYNNALSFKQPNTADEKG